MDCRYTTGNILDSNDIQGVKVEYTYDNGTNWIVIDENIPDPLAGICVDNPRYSLRGVQN